MVFDWFDEGPKRRSIPKSAKEYLHKKQEPRCMYCGRRLSLADMHADHKTPVARGGSNRESNFQMLCSPCNTRKGSMTDGEFRRRYKLTPSRQAKGPPTKSIPLKFFEEISKTTQAKKAKQRRRKANDWW